jgi:RNA polymerase sigma-70 factor (ECF subfamily)
MSSLSKLWLVVITEPDAPVAEVDWFAELEALGRGDVAALARVRRLVTSQLARMGAYAARDAWDDLAQEVVVRVWRAHRDGRVRDASAFPGFVRTTTRNAFIDWTRKHGREVDLPDEAVVANADAQGERPLDPAVQQALRNALATLSDRHREVVERIYLENLSYDETAAALNRPRGTINRLQREAILALRAQLLSGDR